MIIIMSNSNSPALAQRAPGVGAQLSLLNSGLLGSNLDRASFSSLCARRLFVDACFVLFGFEDTHTHVYIYIYTCIHTYIYIYNTIQTWTARALPGELFFCVGVFLRTSQPFCDAVRVPVRWTPNRGVHTSLFVLCPMPLHYNIAQVICSLTLPPSFFCNRPLQGRAEGQHREVVVRRLVHPSAVRCDMVLHQASRARRVRTIMDFGGF